MKNLEKHMEKLRLQVYPEPKFKYHERIIDSAIKNFLKGEYNGVLDIGVGTFYAFKRFVEMGMKPIGITLNKDEVREGTFNGYDVRLMDMNDLGFDDESFDLVWCRHVLEHSVMPMIALMEAKRVLRINGYLYVEVPSDNVIHIDNANHYSMFSDAAWQSLFRKVGMTLLFRGQVAINILGDKQRIGYVDIYWQYWLKNMGDK